jgi:hypothetical protein
MSRRLLFLVTILVGFGLGVLLGWGVLPVKHTDTSLKSLRTDYKTDYVLMVAEVYHADGNLPQAIQYLNPLDDLPVLQIVGNAIAFARQSDYSISDLNLLVQLYQVLQASSAQ